MGVMYLYFSLRDLTEYVDAAPHQLSQHPYFRFWLLLLISIIGRLTVKKWENADPLQDVAAAAML